MIQQEKINLLSSVYLWTVQYVVVLHTLTVDGAEQFHSLHLSHMFALLQWYLFSCPPLHCRSRRPAELTDPEYK